jgi:hypothetical protein
MRRRRHGRVAVRRVVAQPVFGAPAGSLCGATVVSWPVRIVRKVGAASCSALAGRNTATMHSRGGRANSFGASGSLTNEIASPTNGTRLPMTGSKPRTTGSYVRTNAKVRLRSGSVNECNASTRRRFAGEPLITGRTRKSGVPWRKPDDDWVSAHLRWAKEPRATEAGSTPA